MKKIVIVLSVLILNSCFLPSNEQVVKPDNTMKNAIDQVAKSNQETETAVKNIAKDVGEIKTTTTTLNQSITSFKTEIKTDIRQEFETYQGSMQSSFGTFKGDMEKTISTSTNSTWYGIGLVALVLVYMFLVQLVQHITQAKRSDESTIKNLAKRMTGIV
jgi:hypothetical protein